MLAILYDIHGNLPALEAVLAEAEAAGAERYLLGGDYALAGGWPAETVERLDELDDAVWLRGNCERWLVDPPLDGPDEVLAELAAAIFALPAAVIDRLIGLPTLIELDGAFYCHASPRSDMETFGPEAADEDDRLLAGVKEQPVVFGHSHVQFRRSGPRETELVNPGSVGMPLDRDRRAAWALRGADGGFELRRTEYDVERAMAKVCEFDWGGPIARRLEQAVRS